MEMIGVTLESDPNSVCSLSIVDKSVHLLQKGRQLLSLSSVGNFVIASKPENSSTTLKRLRRQAYQVETSARASMAIVKESSWTEFLKKFDLSVSEMQGILNCW